LAFKCVDKLLQIHNVAPTEKRRSEIFIVGGVKCEILTQRGQEQVDILWEWHTFTSWRLFGWNQKIMTNQPPEAPTPLPEEFKEIGFLCVCYDLPSVQSSNQVNWLSCLHSWLCMTRTSN